MRCYLDTSDAMLHPMHGTRGYSSKSTSPVHPDRGVFMAAGRKERGRSRDSPCTSWQHGLTDRTRWMRGRGSNARLDTGRGRKQADIPSVVVCHMVGTTQSMCARIYPTGRVRVTLSCDPTTNDTTD